VIRRLIWLGAIVLVLLVHAFITNRETKDAEARGAKIMDLEGGDLRYRDEGDRDDPVVVLLHGFACSLDWWDRVTPDLVQRGVRVIRFDLLGHGGSEMPRDGYGMDEQAARVAQALERLKVRRAVVIGHSMGGTVATSLVEQKPGLVRRLGVIGTPPRDGFAELPLTGRIAGWPVVGQLVRRLAPDPVIKAGLDSAFAEGTDVPSEFVDDVDGMTYSAYDSSAEASHDFNEAETNAERVKASGKRLLVIFGTEDEIVDPAAADAWQKAIPAAKVVKLPEVGHSPHWEEARQVAEEILDFTR
jgi:pimeloyl-ACP methyl ester carboxylesterase